MQSLLVHVCVYQNAAVWTEVLPVSVTALSLVL